MLLKDAPHGRWRPNSVECMNNRSNKQSTPPARASSIGLLKVIGEDRLVSDRLPTRRKTLQAENPRRSNLISTNPEKRTGARARARRAWVFGGRHGRRAHTIARQLSRRREIESACREGYRECIVKISRCQISMSRKKILFLAGTRIAQVNIGPNVFPLRYLVTVKNIIPAFFASSVPYDTVFN
jgi:hypothetical protein